MDMIPTNHPECCSSSSKYAGHNVGLTCDDGLVRYDKGTSKYYIDSIPLTAKSFREPDLTTMVSNVLNGFLVQQSAEEGLRTIGIGKLASQSSNIEDGESFNTIIAGRLFKVTRDRSLQQSKQVTLQRTMGPYEGEGEPTPMEIIASTFRKRRLDYSMTAEESAKDIRDPNPLQTTMAHLSRKYPISLNTAKAKKHHVPPEFLSNSLDNHRRERTLARMDAIDWWVTQAPLPSTEYQNLIDVLYSFPRKEVKDYMAINWKDTRVRFGSDE